MTDNDLYFGTLVEDKHSQTLSFSYANADPLLNIEAEQKVQMGDSGWQSLLTIILNDF